MVAAALHQDVHIMRGPGTARPAADGMGSSQDKGNLLLGKRTKNLVKMHRRSGHLVAPLGTMLFLEEDAFLNRLIMVEVPAGCFNPLPSRVTHGPVRSSFLLLYAHDCSFPGTGSTSPCQPRPIPCILPAPDHPVYQPRLMPSGSIGEGERCRLLPELVCGFARSRAIYSGTRTMNRLLRLSMN